MSHVSLAIYLKLWHPNSWHALVVIWFNASSYVLSVCMAPVQVWKKRKTAILLLRKRLPAIHHQELAINYFIHQQPVPQWFGKLPASLFFCIYTEVSSAKLL
jgi:hypothetical protein